MRTIDFSRLGLRDNLRILDLGCGQGRHIHGLYYAYAMSCIGLDLSHDDLLHTQKGFDDYPLINPQEGQHYGLTSGDALHLPFADASFDRIICSEVLEHIPDYHAALAEIARILRPGGILALSVPRAWPERLCWWLSDAYHLTPGGHVHIFNARDLRQTIEQAGFDHTGGHFAHGLHSPYWWLKCLMWERRDDHPLIRAYQRFLEWDIVAKPWLTHILEGLARPLMGKSVVFYFTRQEASK